MPPCLHASCINEKACKWLALKRNRSRPSEEPVRRRPRKRPVIKRPSEESPRRSPRRRALAAPTPHLWALEEGASVLLVCGRELVTIWRENEALVCDCRGFARAKCDQPRPVAFSRCERSLQVPLSPRRWTGRLADCWHCAAYRASATGTDEEKSAFEKRFRLRPRQPTDPPKRGWEMAPPPAVEMARPWLAAKFTDEV